MTSIYNTYCHQDEAHTFDHHHQQLTNAPRKSDPAIKRKDYRDPIKSTSCTSNTEIFPITGEVQFK